MTSRRQLARQGPRHRRLAWLLMASLAGCRGSGGPPLPPLAFGAVTSRGDTACLTLPQSTANASGSIVVMLPDQRQSVRAEVLAELPSCPGELPSDFMRYFRLASPDLPAGVLGIAIIADSVRLLPGGRTDLDGDGVPESYHACAGTEGVHLSVWAGQPPAGHRRWHYYHYLGYDITPDCSAAELADGSG